MTKAVFFDWFNTLAFYHPPREGIHAAACRKLGIEVSEERIRRSLPAADQFFMEENARSPVEKRSPEERAQVYAQYEKRMLSGAGVEVSDELALRIMQEASKSFQGLAFALYDDVLPTLELLKQRGLILGLISNIERDMDPVCAELGLAPYLDFMVTSREVGADKPRPPIFLAALEKAKVEASEAIHVGDQYHSDVVGALGVGIRPVLLDRYDLFPQVTDCPKIKSLAEIIECL